MENTRSKRFSFKRSTLLLYAALAILSWVVYAQVLNHEFINYDTPSYTIDNEYVVNGLTIAGVKWAFTTFELSNWHPLTWLSHMLDIELFGNNPGMHHATSVFIHTINVLLLFYLLSLATKKTYVSLFIAAIFAIHPYHVESVAWVAERKDVLSTLFFLLTIIAYYRYTRTPSVARYLPVIILYILGLMTKPMLVTLPVLLLLLDYWPLNRPGSTTINVKAYLAMAPRLVLEKMPLFLFSAISSFITIKAQLNAGSLHAGLTIDIFDRLGNAIVAYSLYVKNLIVPGKLALYYPHPVQWPIEIILLSATVLIIITVFSLIKIEKMPYFFVGWAFFLCALLPVIGILQTGGQSMADRYTYIPYIGLSIAVVFLISDLVNKIPVKPGIIKSSAFVVIIAYSISSIVYISHWKNSITIWTHTLLATDSNYPEILDLNITSTKIIAGNGYSRGRDTFITDTNEKRLLYVGLWVPYVMLGEAYYDAGEYETAVKHQRIVTLLRPDYPEGLYFLGRSLLYLGSFESAFAALDKVVELDPDHERAVEEIRMHREMFEKLFIKKNAE